jgi:hypothetical protein
MGIETIVGAGASLVGGAMSASGAKAAARIQADATREANALQERQYEQTRNDLAPYRGLGSGATNKLAQLLGLDAPAPQVSAADRDAIRQRLLSQYTRTVSGGQGSTNSQIGYGGYWSTGSPESGEWISTVPASTTTVDEAALNAAIEREISQSQQQSQQQADSARQSPDFGSLMRDFTGADLENEPGYQFGLQQGQRALDNRLAAAGSYFSGAALKGASRFNQDYAGTKYGEAFNRDAANKTRKYNFLTGAVGTGQSAAAGTAQAGANMAGQVGANTTAMGNAAGAARIAQGNAWGNALQNAAGGYQQQQLMDRILGGNVGMGTRAARGYAVPTYDNPEY